VRYRDSIKIEPHLGTYARLLRHFRLSARREQLGSRWDDFYVIWCLGIFRKFVEENSVCLESGKNERYFTRRPVCIYVTASLNFS